MADKETEKMQKLAAAKEKWAEEGRGLTGRMGDKTKDRLPPGQRKTQDWPVLDLGVQPNITTKDWKLTVGGLVENPIEWDWDAFMAQPQRHVLSDIHCVTTWSRYDNEWIGISARQLLEAVRPKPSAKFLMFRSYDGYSTNLALERFDDTDVLLAHSWNGNPIERRHGGPVRVVAPKLYFWKSAKWLRHITFMEHDQPGYWEARGYHNEGDPWKEERYG